MNKKIYAMDKFEKAIFDFQGVEATLNKIRNR